MSEIKYVDYSNAKLSKDELRKVMQESVIIRKFRFDEITYLEKNANIMTDKTMERLVENVEYDGMLTQLPFLHKLPSGKYEVISGNHRVQSAEKAGLKEFYAMAAEVTLPKDQKLRIQISHNSIRGEQRNAVLIELVDEFEDTEMLRLSAADFDIEKLDNSKVDFLALDAGGLDFRDVMFYFTEYEINKMDRLLADLDHRLLNQKSPTYLVMKEKHEKFVDAVTKIKNEANIKSTAVVINLIIDYIHKHKEEFVNEVRGEKEK